MPASNLSPLAGGKLFIVIRIYALQASYNGLDLHMNCPSCAMENRDGALFCDERGASLVVAAEGPHLSAQSVSSTGFIVRQKLAHLLANRAVGLHSPKAMTIIEEVCASHLIPDPPDIGDPTTAVTEYTRKIFVRNRIIQQRLTKEWFVITL